MGNFSLKEEFKLLLPLEDLRRELSELEAGSFADLSDEELREKIRLIHTGFIFNAPIYPAGTLVYRAVRVTERPFHKSRISYPPPQYARVNGRLNEVGKPMFYGALNQFASCLLECGHKVGEFFAVSAWLTTSIMTMNHLGYSQAVLDLMKTRRELPSFAKWNTDDERNKMIREWQCRVFTATVPCNQEHLYRLPIALKNFALGRMVQTYPNAPTLFSGVIYPSIAMWLLGDNIAILPSEVDSKMNLFEVILLAVDSVTVTPTDDGGTETAHSLKTYDYARSDEEGNLLWGQTSRIVYPPGVTPPAIKDLAKER
ncbi:MAG TPA: hypothetical protein VJ723_11820 [Candidatus Angelobacter sp.]|nr:hypothetical protein [Candidatus Angelobacter sp.]